MSEFFENKKEEQSQYIPPDYTDEADKIGPTDSDDDNDDDDFSDLDLEEEDEEDEGKIESLLDEQNRNNERLMQATPFGNPSPSPSPTWGTQGGSMWGNGVGGSSYWGSGNGGNNSGSVWGRPGNSNNLWGAGSVNQSTNGKSQLDRSKKVIFIDFLDAIVETYQSEGRPGLVPRDIYDVKPRFDVWQKLAAFNPEKVYALIPRNLLKDSTGLPEGLDTMMSYFCCSLAAFLRLPYNRCQVLVQGRVGQYKEEIIKSIMKGGQVKIPEQDVVLIGINSGLYGQSNADIVAANNCGITYYDLNQLLNNMY